MLILFDVDGTLTPSRGTIDPDFKIWLMRDLRYPFRLITGSDPEKTIEQVGQDLWSSCVSYNCAANHIFDHGCEVYKSDWHLPNDLEWILNGKLIASDYPVRTGRHFEHRVGLCNFSVVGRGATVEQRHHYYEWDCKHGERERIAKLIRHCWPEVEATVAGETGIDIYCKGAGKDQVIDRILEHEPIHFFGDRQDPEGNDFGLAQAILTNNMGMCYHVKNWQHTWQLLKELNDR
jgi:hydroxymethylpyrimidine pyrophosphatase-like HAD family hydrolase